MSFEELTRDLPGIGVCPYELRRVASAFSSMFGARGASAADILSAAINQAMFELVTVGGRLGDSHELYFVVDGIRQRLDAANETASTLAKLISTIPPIDKGAP